MFCEKCGKQINDGESLCPACAAYEAARKQEIHQAVQNDQPTIDATPAQGGANNSSEYADSANQKNAQGNACPSCGTSNPYDQRYRRVCGTALIHANQNFGTNNQNTTQNRGVAVGIPPEKTKKSMSKKAKVTVCSILIAAILCVSAAAWAFWPQLTTWWNNTFTPPIAQSEEGYTRDIAKAITKMKDKIVNGVATSSEAEITLGDKFNTLIEDLSGTDISPYTDWIDTLSLSGDVSVKGPQMRYAETLRVNGSDLLDLDYSVDYTDMSMYVGFPSYNSQYIQLSTNTDERQLQMMQETYAGMETVFSAIPDEDTLKNTLDRYVECIESAMGPIEETETTLAVNGVSQDVKVSTIKLSEQDGNNIAKALIAEAKNDEILKKYINDISSVTGADAKDFVKAITQTEEYLNDGSEETAATIYVYTDAEDEFVGFKIEVDGEEMSYYAVTNGDQISVELQIPISSQMGTVTLEFSGTGTITDGKINGNFAVKVMGMDIITIRTENYKADGTGGTVFVSANKAIATIDESMSTIADISLKISWETLSETEGTAKIEVYYDNGLALTVNNHAIEKEFRGISYPTDTLSLDINNPDEEDLMNWTKGTDFTKLIENLRQAKLPSEWTDMLEQAYMIYTSPLSSLMF